jgi:hypothetical protein
MRLLLDTHLLLWATGMSRRLPIATRQLLERASMLTIYPSAVVVLLAVIPTFRVMAIYCSGTRCVPYIDVIPIIQE